MLPIDFITTIRRAFVKGVILTPYKCAYSSASITIQNTDRLEYNNFSAALLKNNFNKVADNLFGNVSFKTFVYSLTSPAVTIHVIFYPSTHVVKIWYGCEASFVPPACTQNIKKNDTTLTQLGRIAVYQPDNAAPGMLYILQLNDGRYILIDGGPSDSIVQPMKKDAEKGWISDGFPRKSDSENALKNFLKENSRNEKPIIACWIFTHAHHDHLELATDFINKHHESIELETIAYNFPDYTSTDYLNGSSRQSGSLVKKLLKATNSHFPDIKHWIMHTGQQVYFPSCKINVIFTHEDLFPIAQYSANCSSVAFIAELGSKKICFLGDCDSSSTRFLDLNYSSELKCNVLQVTHHGANGGNLSLYKKISPEICLWPISDFVADTSPKQKGLADGYEFNKWLLENAKTHFYENTTHTIICK